MGSGRRRKHRQPQRALDPSQQASQVGHQTPILSVSQKNRSFYESNLFWGSFTSAISIVLTVLATVKKDLRPLLFIAWPFAVTATYVVAHSFLSSRKTWGVVLFASLLVGFGLRELNPWSAPNVEYPHLDPELVIDSASVDSAATHIEIENIGMWQVNNLRGALSTSGMMTADAMPFPPSLPPHGHLSILDPPFFGIGKGGVVFLDLTYTSSVSGTANGFRSRYSFIVPPIGATPMTIRPSQWQESAGVSNGDQDQIRNVINQLSAPRGTIMLTLPERNPKGLPNFALLSNNGKVIFFDPISRTVSFQVPIENGRKRIVSEPILMNQDGVHTIAFAWDNQGVAKLMVDGRGDW